MIRHGSYVRTQLLLDEVVVPVQVVGGPGYLFRREGRVRFGREQFEWREWVVPRSEKAVTERFTKQLQSGNEVIPTRPKSSDSRAAFRTTLDLKDEFHVPPLGDQLRRIDVFHHDAP